MRHRRGVIGGDTSTAAVNLPLPPLGRLGIDPGCRAATQVIGSFGTTSLELTVPYAPLLVGLPVYVQALMVAQPALTNVVSTAILR